MRLHLPVQMIYLSMLNLEMNCFEEYVSRHLC
jgi:hypothetical protein